MESQQVKPRPRRERATGTLRVRETPEGLREIIDLANRSGVRQTYFLSMALLLGARRLFAGMRPGEAPTEGTAKYAADDPQAGERGGGDGVRG